MTDTQIELAVTKDGHQERTLLYKLLGVASRLLPDERIANCSKYLTHGAQAVTIKRNPADGKTWFHGVQHCSSIWNCPVCANRITEFRRRELTEALKDCPYEVVMITYTLRHKRDDKLSVLKKALKKAYARTKSGRAYQELREEFAIVGSIRTVEPTWSPANGWHVHIHELMLMDKNYIDREQPGFLGYMQNLETWLKRHWQHCLELEGRDASWERGIDLNAREDVSKTYIAKAQVAAEVTRSVNKKARGREGVTPFGMLEKIRQGEAQYAALFMEYAAEFKGDRQLFWSHGLKELLGIKNVEDNEITDAMVQELPAEQFEDIVSLEWQQWKTVWRRDLRGELLKVASTDGRRGVYDFLLNIGVDIGLSMWARGAPIDTT